MMAYCQQLVDDVMHCDMLPLLLNIQFDKNLVYLSSMEQPQDDACTLLDVGMLHWALAYTT